MIKKILTVIWVLSLATATLASPLPSFAQCDPDVNGVWNLGDCVFLGRSDGGSQQTVGEVYSTPAVLINVIVTNIFVIAGVILFLLMIYSGYLFITKESKGIEEARSTLTTAIIGLVVMFSAFWVVQIVQIMTGISILF